MKWRRLIRGIFYTTLSDHLIHKISNMEWESACGLVGLISRADDELIHRPYHQCLNCKRKEKQLAGTKCFK